MRLFVVDDRQGWIYIKRHVGMCLHLVLQIYVSTIYYKIYSVYNLDEYD